MRYLSKVLPQFPVPGHKESFMEISRQCSIDGGTVLNIDKTFNLTKTHKITICSYRQRNLARRKDPQRNPLLVGLFTLTRNWRSDKSKDDKCHGMIKNAILYHFFSFSIDRVQGVKQNDIFCHSST